LIRQTYIADLFADFFSQIIYS